MIPGVGRNKKFNSIIKATNKDMSSTCMYCGEVVEWIHNGWCAIPIHVSGNGCRKSGSGRRSLGGGAMPWELQQSIIPGFQEWNYNAKCPVCDADVFFIRHNGGCVWLDSLGWPWPKHECMLGEIDGYAVFEKGMSLHSASGLVRPGLVIRAKQVNNNLILLAIALTNDDVVSLMVFAARLYDIPDFALVKFSNQGRPEKIILHDDSKKYLVFYDRNGLMAKFESDWWKQEKAIRKV